MLCFSILAVVLVYAALFFSLVAFTPPGMIMVGALIIWGVLKITS